MREWAAPNGQVCPVAAPVTQGTGWQAGSGSRKAATVSCAMRQLHCKRIRYLGSWLEMKGDRGEIKKQPPYCLFALLAVLHSGLV